MRIVKWRFKTLVKIIIAVFVATTFIVHYTNEKFERTAQILKGIGSRSAKELVQPFVDTFLINNHWLLKEVEGKEVININGKAQQQDDPFLVVVVTSQPDNEERRNIIRDSWMQFDTEKTTVIVFFCGKPKLQEDLNKLQKESEKYGDIIVDDFEESYYGLTVKTLRILKWFSMNLPRSNFLVKTDDDVFVNTPRLLQHLQRVEKKLKFESQSEEPVNYMGGVVFTGRSPHTLNTFSKWYVPPKLWKDEVSAIKKLMKAGGKEDYVPLSGYPPYLEGNFYAIAGPTVPLLINASLTLPLFHLEDVYLTGLVGSELLNIKLRNIPNVFSDSAIWPDLNYKYNTWFTSPKDMIAYHCDTEVGIITRVYEESRKT